MSGGFRRVSWALLSGAIPSGPDSTFRKTNVRFAVSSRCAASIPRSASRIAGLWSPPSWSLLARSVGAEERFRAREGTIAMGVAVAVAVAVVARAVVAGAVALHLGHGGCCDGSRLAHSINATPCYIGLIRSVVASKRLLVIRRALDVLLGAGRWLLLESSLS